MIVLELTGIKRHQQLHSNQCVYAHNSVSYLAHKLTTIQLVSRGTTLRVGITIKLNKEYVMLIII